MRTANNSYKTFAVLQVLKVGSINFRQQRGTEMWVFNRIRFIAERWRQLLGQTAHMSGKIVKYLIYLVGLATSGFVFMYILRPVTEGAHDGGFLGMVFGLTVGQVIFSSWLTNLKWYLAIPFGLFLAAVTIYLSYWTIGTIRDIYNPITPGGFFRDPDEQLEDKLAWIFFIVVGLSSVILIAGLNKLTTYKTERLDTVE